MSNNLYNILKNFNKLTEDSVSKKDTPSTEKIYESVEARGSVKNGLETVLAEKYMGFKKTEKAVAKNPKVDNPAAVAASIGREKYGQKEMTRRAVAGKKHAHESHDQVEESGLQYYTGVKKYGKKGMEELAQAGREGANQEQLGRIKDKYVKKSHNVDEGVMDQIRAANYDRLARRSERQADLTKPGQVSAYDVRKGVKADQRTAKAKELRGMTEAEMMEKAPPGMEDMVLKLKKEYPGHPEKAFATAWSIYNKKHGKHESMGESDVPMDKKGEYDDEAGMARNQLHNASKAAKELESIIGSGEDLPEWVQAKITLAADYLKKVDDVMSARHEHGMEYHEDTMESTCNECGMWESECGCDHAMNEDYTHKGRAYGGAAQKDDEEEDEDDTPKKRGRPKKKESERSDAKLPKFGDKQYKLPAHKGSTHRHSMSDEPPKGSPERAEWEEKQAKKDKALARKKKKTSETYSRLESRFREVLGEGVNYKKIMDNHHMTMDEMLECLRTDAQAYKQHGHMSDLLRDCMEIHNHGKKQLADEGYFKNLDIDRQEQEMKKARHNVGKGELNQVPGMQNIKPQATGIGAKIKDTVKGIMGHDDVEHWELTKPQDEGMEPTLESELNELARLAGLKIADESTHGEYIDDLKQDAKAHGKKEIHAFGQDIPVDEAEMEEGAGVMHYKAEKAREAGKDSFELGGKTYPVKEATTLEDIAKLAGLKLEARDYGDTDFNKPAEYNNTPDEKIMDADTMLQGGDGEVAGMEKKMTSQGAARFSDNPKAMKKDVGESAEIDPLESLGRKLLKQYESIKVTK